jgi:hypothetical protein
MAQETTIRLDRDRRLKYRVSDLRELCRRLGNIGIKQLLEKLGDMDLEALIHTLHVGLRWEEPKMRIDRAEELLQIAIDKDGSLKQVMQAVIEGLVASGVIGEPTRGNAGSPETSPGQSLDS